MVLSTVNIRYEGDVYVYQDFHMQSCQLVVLLLSLKGRGEMRYKILQICRKSTWYCQKVLGCRLIEQMVF